jgi:hypothetical protein
MIWPSEIDAEMDGQSVAVVGEIAAVTQLFTRERKPFVKAVIEDISGSIETMVWPRVYDSDRELWQEGNTIVVEGRVRVKDDGVQLNCDRARVYRPIDQVEGEGAGSRGQEAEDCRQETGGSGENGGRNGKNGVAGNGKNGTAERSEGRGQTPERNGKNGKNGPVPSDTDTRPFGPKRRLLISMEGTEDKEGDIARLRKVLETVKEFAGEDEVNLCLRTEGQVTNLKIPGVSTRYCRALHDRVAEVVGEEGVKVEILSQ